MQNQDKSSFLGTEKLFPLLIRLSVPTIIGMMVAALYNITDTIFVGRGVGPMAIAGLSIAFPIQMIAQGLALMIATGAASIISRRLGEKKPEEASRTFGTAVSALILGGIILTLLISLFLKPILKVFGSSESILPYATAYMKTIVWGFTFFGMSMGANSLIRAEGNARTAMNCMLIGLILNMALDPLMIFVFHMGIRGAAIATIISQFFSFLWAFQFYAEKKSILILKRKYFRIKGSLLKEMSILGFPNFVQSTGTSILALVVITTAGRLGGDLAVSTYGIMQRLLSFIFMPMVGIAMGFQPIAGYNYGAKLYQRVKSVLFLAIISGTAIALFFYLIVRLNPDLLVGLFTTDTELIQKSVQALKIMSLLMPIISIQIVSATYFQAVGKGTISLLLGTSRTFLFLIPATIILPRIFGLNGVWAAFPTADFLSILVTVTAILFEIKNLRVKHQESAAEILTVA
jgi:putative MATE family efflux protein